MGVGGHKVEEKQQSSGGGIIPRLKAEHLVTGREVRRVPSLTRYDQSEHNPTTRHQES